MVRSIEWARLSDRIATQHRHVAIAAQWWWRFFGQMVFRWCSDRAQHRRRCCRRRTQCHCDHKLTLDTNHHSTILVAFIWPRGALVVSRWCQGGVS
eukprot:4695002-Pyramimonas_sp.AAC.1